MTALQQVLATKRGGDGWSRMNPESVAPPAVEPDTPLTFWDPIWYCLLTPPLLWWVFDLSPRGRTRLGAVVQFAWFYFGMPPAGLLDARQWAVFTAIVLGLPAASVALLLAAVEPLLGLIVAVFFLLLALIRTRVYFAVSGQR